MLNTIINVKILKKYFLLIIKNPPLTLIKFLRVKKHEEILKIIEGYIQAYVIKLDKFINFL